MIKENQKLFNRLNVLTDAAAAFVSITAAYLLVFNLLDFERNYPLADYFKLLIIFVPVQLLTYGCMGLYGSFRSKRFTNELGLLFTAFLLDGLALVALLYVVQIINFSRWALAIFLVMDFLLVAAKRFVLRKVLKKFRSSGYNQKYVLIVGSGAAARDYLSTIKEEKHLGFVCAGYVSEGELPGAVKKGEMSSLLTVLEENSYDEVVCALDPGDDDKLGSVVEACELTGTKISVIPSIYRYMSSTPEIDMVGNIPMMNIRRIPLDNIGNAILKRTVDIVGSLVLLILTSPMILVSMLVIKLTMGGDVIFRQKRVGLNKKVFTMYKLKSMRDSAESDTAWSKDTDPRRTKFGAFIRKFSIDELPQLVNVLKGEMSLVGPRPEIPFFVEDFKDKIPMYMIKHQVKPGITGLAQINGYRGDTSIEKRIEFDVQYIENWSFFMDISILIRTALSGFMNSEKLPVKKNADGGRQKINIPEKHNMNNNKAKIDLMALAMFLPSVIAAAVIPIIIHISKVTTAFEKTYQYFGGNAVTADDGTVSYELYDAFSQGKGVALIVFALIMVGMALVCCVSLFRRIEKRSLVYVGSSLVFLVTALVSAVNSAYQNTAFFGEYDRAEGFWSLACYFVLFLFSMYAFRTAGNFKPLSIALFVAVGVNVVIGLFQMAGHDLLSMDWFVNLIRDRSLSDVDLTSTSVTNQAYGALYNANYVGSFGGLIIPLFTVMAIYSGEKVWRFLYIIFDLLAVFFLLGSSARSGIVAVAAAFVVGVVVFARQIGKHWKRCAAIVVTAAVVLTGANFVLENKLFSHVPSLVKDAVGLFLPADEADKDIYSALPLREINTPGDNTLLLTGQNDVLTVSYDADTRNYRFTDSTGSTVRAISTFTLDVSGFDSLKITANYLEKYADIFLGDAHMRYSLNDDGTLTDDNRSGNVPEAADVSITSNALGVVTVSDSTGSFYMEYDPDYKRLFFAGPDEQDIKYNESVSFPGVFDGLHLMLMNSEDSSLVRDVIALTFNKDSGNSLFFMLENEKRIKMIHYRTSERFDPVEAEHIGFEGKEKLGSSRGYIWSRTIPLLKDCLLTGYGADTFAYVFPQNDVLAKYYAYSDFHEGFYVTVDKPHNLYLQIFYGNGLIALIAFLTICVFYLVDSLRLYALRREYRPEQIMGAAVMLGVVGYLAAGLFNDSVVHVAPVFWILIGVGAALNTINRRADRNIEVDEEYVPVQPEPQPTPAEEQKKAETADAAQKLAALIRQSQNKSAEGAPAPSKEDISNLLQSVRAMREKYEAEKKSGDKHDDNG